MRGAPARLTPTRVPSHHSANHSDPNNHGHLSLTLTPRSESRQVLRLAALRNTTRIRRCASHNNLKQKRRTNGCPARTPSRFIIHSKAKKTCVLSTHVTHIRILTATVGILPACASNPVASISSPTDQSLVGCSETCSGCGKAH